MSTITVPVPEDERAKQGQTVESFIWEGNCLEQKEQVRESLCANLVYLN